MLLLRNALGKCKNISPYVEENKHSGLNKIFTAVDTCHM